MKDFVKKAKWTEAQHQVFLYWASLPKAQSQTVIAVGALERGKRRRRIEKIAESRQRKLDFTEVWE